MNNSLDDLNLGHCGIADRGARAIGAALEENTRLRGLNVASNGITDDGVVALARGLISNAGLNALDLTGNHLTCLAAEVVAEALQGECPAPILPVSSATSLSPDNPSPLPGYGFF